MLESVIEEIKDQKKTLLLHSCCAPCTSYVIEYLNKYFDITIYFYNPNIMPKSEYNKRLREFKKLLNDYPHLKMINEFYDNDEYLKRIEGLGEEREGIKRCFECYKIRLEKTAKLSEKNKFDYFATTLTVSPYQNTNKINEIGSSLAVEFNTKYLYSDFKKKNGYQKSIELSKKYNLYRQNYCGCLFSKKV